MSEPSRRGRPEKPVSPETASEITSVLDRLGPCVGLPTLEACFPGVGRRAITRIRDRHRADFIEAHAWLIRSIRWPRIGAVWAADHAYPLRAIDGAFGRLFAARDLASGYPLAGLAVPDQRVGSAIAVLDVLVRTHGAPLVLKIDNGSAFRSERFKAWADRHAIELLYSPPHYPQYNGAIEAGVGRLETFALWEAAHHDRPADWTCDDLYGAVERLRDLPETRSQQPRRQRWADRLIIDDEERAGFRTTVTEYHYERKEELGIARTARLDHWDDSAIGRFAIERALLEHGYMSMRMRRLPPRFNRKKAAIFS